MQLRQRIRGIDSKIDILCSIVRINEGNLVLSLFETSSYNVLLDFDGVTWWDECQRLAQAVPESPEVTCASHSTALPFSDVSAVKIPQM